MLRQLAIKVFHTTGCGICITTVGLYMPTVTESLLGCCAHRLSRLQSVLHAAAQMIYNARRCVTRDTTVAAVCYHNHWNSNYLCSGLAVYAWT